MHYSKREQEMNDLKEEVAIIVKKKDDDILWLMQKTEVCTFCQLMFLYTHWA